MWFSLKTYYELFIKGLVRDTLPCKYCGLYPKERKVKVRFSKIPLYILECNCRNRPHTEILSTFENVVKEWNRENS